MPIPDPVFLPLSLSISRLIVRVWVRDNDVASDIYSTIAEILARKGVELRSRRNAERQLEKIGEQFADALEPFFASEGMQLDDNERCAVALAASTALTNTPFDLESLIRANLDPAQLARQVYAANPSSTRLFTEKETSFYEALVSASCRFVVDVSDKLPSFSVHAFAELFRQGDELLAITNDVLMRVRTIEEISRRGNPEIERVRFETDYRRAAARTVEQIEFFGIDSPVPRKYPLDVAYISLTVNQINREVRHSGLTQVVQDAKEHLARSPLDNMVKSHLVEALESFDSIEQMSSYVSHQADIRSNAGTHLVSAIQIALLKQKQTPSVEEFLSTSPRILIRGAAGSGKTTLLKWIALQSAQGTFTSVLAEWNRLVPFFIPLRRFATDRFPAPEELPIHLAPLRSGDMPQGWAHSILGSGRGLVLIDGLDELRLGRREQVHEWLTQMVAEFPKSYFVVTSRPHAMQETWVDLPYFRVAELRPMDLPAVNIFIEKWHEAEALSIQNRSQLNDRIVVVDRLKEIVRRERSIRYLATSPLLCAMLCALHRHRQNYLPKDRLELYRAFCAMLLERREQGSSIDLTDYPILTERQKEILIEDLAYWMAKNDKWEIPTTELDDWLTYRYSMMGGKPDASSTDIRRLFVERIALLREPSDGIADFTHRSFQEYLAAKAIVRERDLGYLSGKADDQQWRDIIVMAAGMANSKEAGKLIVRLLEKGSQKPKRQHQYISLAVACLENLVDLSDDIRKLVLQRLPELFPPNIDWSPREIAIAGDALVPFFEEYEPKCRSAEIAHWCMQVLVEVGSEVAFKAMSLFAKSFPAYAFSKSRELREFFTDNEEFGRKVLLPILAHVEHLDIDFVDNLDGFETLGHLKSLQIARGPANQPIKLGPLASLRKLESIALGTQVVVSDLDPLASLSQLESLIVFNCSKVDSIAPMSTLRALTLVRAHQLFRVKDISSLAELENLTIVELKGLPFEADHGVFLKSRQITFCSPALGGGVKLSGGLCAALALSLPKAETYFYDDDEWLEHEFYSEALEELEEDMYCI